MRRIRIHKVAVNIGVGEAAERLEKAEKLLESLTGQKPIRTLSKGTIRDWSLRTGMPIGCKVTLRGEPAEAFVKRALWPRQNRVAAWSFDQEGNMQFGVADHTGMEGQKYDPNVGIFGMDVSVVIARAGRRVKERRLAFRRIPHRHRVDRDEAVAFLKERFQLEIV